MQTTFFKVRFSGDTVEGFSSDQIVTALEKLGMPADKARQLLQSRSAVLRSGLSLAQAEQWAERLRGAGLVVELVEQTSQAEQPAEVAPVVSSTPPVKDAVDSAQRVSPVQFSGQGAEYFGIWIVNIILMVLTLGFYAPWAKVRNNQYFYGHTSVEGSSFQYLADPWVIFRGRLIALVALIVWVVVSNLSMVGALVLMLLFIPLAPWVVVAALRFNMHNSAWRNIRFGFDGSYWQAFMVLYVWPLLSILTLGLLVPYSMYRSQKFVLDNTRFGTTPFSLQLTAGDYYLFVLKMLGMVLLLVIGGSLFMLVPVIGPLGGLLIFAAYLLAFGYFMAALPNMVYRSLKLGTHGFESRLGKRRMVWIFFSNTLFIVLTLGLFTPWAKVRMARYRASCTDVLVNGDLDQFLAAEQRQQSALGMELGEAFDVGVLGV